MTRVWGRIEHPADSLILFSSHLSLITTSQGEHDQFLKIIVAGVLLVFLALFRITHLQFAELKLSALIGHANPIGAGLREYCSPPSPLTLSETGSQERQGQIESVIWNELTSVYWTKEETDTQQKYCLHWTIPKFYVCWKRYALFHFKP